MAKFPFLIGVILASVTSVQLLIAEEPSVESVGEVTEVHLGPAASLEAPDILKIRCKEDVQLVPWQRLSLYRSRENEDGYLGPIFVQKVVGNVVFATGSGLQPAAGDTVRETALLDAYGSREGRLLELERLDAVIKALQEQRISIPFAIQYKEEAIRKISPEMTRLRRELSKANEDRDAALKEKDQRQKDLKKAEEELEAAKRIGDKQEGKLAALQQEVEKAQKKADDAEKALAVKNKAVKVKKADVDEYKSGRSPQLPYENPEKP